jgi:hypothetical protein
MSGQNLVGSTCVNTKTRKCFLFTLETPCMQEQGNWKRITQYAIAVIAPHNNGNQRKPMWFENLNIMKMIGQVENCNQIRKHYCQRPLLKCPRNEYRLSLSSCLNVLHASAVRGAVPTCGEGSQVRSAILRKTFAGSRVQQTSRKPEVEKSRFFKLLLDSVIMHLLSL